MGILQNCACLLITMWIFAYPNSKLIVPFFLKGYCPFSLWIFYQKNCTWNFSYILIGNSSKLTICRFTYQYGSLIGPFLKELLSFLKILLHFKWIYKCIQTLAQKRKNMGGAFVSKITFNMLLFVTGWRFPYSRGYRW